MKLRPFLLSSLTVSIILIASASLIAYGRGYRLDLNKPTELSPTGIVTATSDPVAAQVLVNGLLKTATNNSFNLAPDWYTVTIQKEGYIPWQKKLRVQGEVVTRADAYLFPTSPSLSPITTSGVFAPAVSPDGGTVAFFNGRGLFTLELADRSLGGRNRDPKLIAEGTFSTTTRLQWSPDAFKILVTDRLPRPGPLRSEAGEAGKIGTLYDLTKTPAPIVPSAETAEWPQNVADRERAKLAAFKQPFIDVATSSAKILAFSPDETKLLYEATASATIPLAIDPPLIGTNPTEEARAIRPGNVYVYDSREDKNYFIEDGKKLRQEDSKKITDADVLRSYGLTVLPSRIQWLPTNKHLLLMLPGKIDVMEYDRTNWITLYAGPFSDDFLTPWPTGGRLVILTNLNPGASTLPNLYTVNLR